MSNPTIQKIAPYPPRCALAPRVQPHHPPRCPAAQRPAFHERDNWCMTPLHVPTTALSATQPNHALEDPVEDRYSYYCLLANMSTLWKVCGKCYIMRDVEVLVTQHLAQPMFSATGRGAIPVGNYACPHAADGGSKLRFRLSLRRAAADSYQQAWCRSLAMCRNSGATGGNSRASGIALTTGQYSA